MNVFDYIIKKSTNHIKENATNTSVQRAADAIEKALKTSANVKADPIAKDISKTLFNTDVQSGENHLGNALKKIQENPENPNLSDVELKSFLDVATKLNPEKKEETKPEGSTYKTQTTTTQSDQKTSQQPNSTQYNPLNQQ